MFRALTSSSASTSASVSSRLVSSVSSDVAITVVFLDVLTHYLRYEITDIAARRRRDADSRGGYFKLCHFHEQDAPRAGCHQLLGLGADAPADQRFLAGTLVGLPAGTMRDNQMRQIQEPFGLMPAGQTQKGIH